MLFLRYLAPFVLVASAHASVVKADSFATDLIGATVTVTRFGGLMSSATFVDAGGGSVSATSPGSAGFVLTVSAGDTFDSTWLLTNTDTSLIIFNHITAVSIDLLGTSPSALFDDGSAPSTFDSAGGRLGVLYLAGNGISSAAEVNPWTDPSNKGDMFTGTNIVFSKSLGPLDTSSWKDDTDIVSGVPEPATVLTVGLALIALGLRRRR